MVGCYSENEPSCDINENVDLTCNCPWELSDGTDVDL